MTFESFLVQAFAHFYAVLEEHLGDDQVQAEDSEEPSQERESGHDHACHFLWLRVLPRTRSSNISGGRPNPALCNRSRQWGRIPVAEK
jgi:hypothetical protein